MELLYRELLPRHFRLRVRFIAVVVGSSFNDFFVKLGDLRTQGVPFLEDGFHLGGSRGARELLLEGLELALGSAGSREGGIELLLESSVVGSVAGLGGELAAEGLDSGL